MFGGVICLFVVGRSTTMRVLAEKVLNWVFVNNESEGLNKINVRLTDPIWVVEGLLA